MIIYTGINSPTKKAKCQKRAQRLSSSPRYKEKTENTKNTQESQETRYYTQAFSRSCQKESNPFFDPILLPKRYETRTNQQASWDIICMCVYAQVKNKNNNQRLS